MTMPDRIIRPFEVHARDEDLADLRRRVAATRWPPRELVADRSQGVQLATIHDLVTYWGTGYDWRRCEAQLNALPQFKTEIDGLDIHFIHVKSRHADALPLIITHGWPGSCTAEPPGTRSISSSRRCPATDSRPRRRRSAGTRAVPRGPGRS